MVMCGGQQKAMLLPLHAMRAARRTGCTAAVAVAPGPATELCPVPELQLGSTAVSSCATTRHWALCSPQEQSCGTANALRVRTNSFISTKVNGPKPRPARVRAPSAEPRERPRGRRRGSSGTRWHQPTRMCGKNLKCAERAHSHTSHETCTSPPRSPVVCVCVLSLIKGEKAAVALQRAAPTTTTKHRQMRSPVCRKESAG